MSTSLRLHDDRLFPAEASARRIARALYESVKDLPINRLDEAEAFELIRALTYDLVKVAYKL